MSGRAEALNLKVHNSPPDKDKLVVYVVLRSGAQVMRLERIEQHAHVVLSFPYTPFGYHITYHDANKAHAGGRINIRVSCGKGLFKRFPGGQILGHEAASWDAPTFDSIQGVVPVPPGPIAFVNPDALVAQSPLRKRSTGIDHTVEIDLGALKGDSLGSKLLLVQPGNIDALRAWLAQEESGWQLGMMTVEEVNLYQAFRPWLAVVVASLSH